MRYLSLFSGAGGGDLAMQHLLGFRCVGYVEIEDYCQRLIRQRIEDGLLDAAPIFGDIRQFNSEGYAAAYTGMVDLITGGFPCTDIAVCKKNPAGIWGEESGLWKEMAQTIRTVQPQYTFVENSPALTLRGLGELLGDLAEMGLDAKWGVLGGSATNCICEGERLWIIAFASNGAMLEGLDFSSHIFSCSKESCGRQHSRAVGKMLQQDDYTRIKRNPDAVARGMDRLKAIGNGQNPWVAATAFRILAGKGGIRWQTRQ